MGAFWDAWNKQGQVNQQHSLGQLQQVRGLAGLMQEARAQQDQVALRGILSDPSIPIEKKREAALGLVRDPAQAASMMHAIRQDEINSQRATAQADRANRQIALAEQKEAQEARQAQAGEALAQYVSQGTNEPSASGVPTKIMMDEEAAIRDAQEAQARGERVRTEVLDPNRIRGLQALIDPKAAATGLLAPPKTDGSKLLNVGPGSVILDPITRQPVFTAPFAPRAEPKTTPYSDIGKIRADVAAGLITPADGEAALKALQAKKDITIDRGTVANAFKFRQEYTSNPEVKRANMLESSITPIAQYIANVPKTGMNPTADLALVKAFLSITHPKGDQISNLDRKELGQLGTLAGRFGNSIESFIAGKNLPDNVRMDMWNEVSSRYKGLREQRDRLKAGIIKRAEQARVPADLIFEE